MKTNNSHKTNKITFVLVGLVTAIGLASAGSTRAATWTQKADMPTPRGYTAASEVNGKIYVIGDHGAGNKVEEYNPVTDTWTQKADMPTPRYALATSVVNGKIYAVGGVYSGATLVTVEEYDPATDTWTKKADMPTARSFVSTSVINGKIYAFGGQTSNAWPAFSAVEEYDPVTDTWTKKADMPAPRSFSTSVMDGKIYAFGGNTSRGGAPISTLTQYDPATDAWTTKDDMPVRMLGMGTSVVGRRVYVIGGTSVPHPYTPSVSTVWEFIPAPEFDFNEDGVVDARDMSIMVDHWHTDVPRYDLAPPPAGDGIVDVQDLIALSEHLFEDYRFVAHWMLDETEGITAYDSVGINDGYVAGSPVWQPDSGQVGGALQLDGVDDYVGTPFVRNPVEGPSSFFAWVRGGAPGQVIVSQFGGQDWLLIDSAGALMTDLKGIGRTAQSLYSNAVLTDGNWHRVGLTWDSTARSLYVDDVVVAEDEPSRMPDVSEGLNIGCSATLEPGTFFWGLIDDVRIYNRAVKP